MPTLGLRAEYFRVLELSASMSKAFDLRDSPEWETRTRYYFLSTVRHVGRFYCCVEEHVSGDFSADHHEGRWHEFDPEES